MERTGEAATTGPGTVVFGDGGNGAAGDGDAALVGSGGGDVEAGPVRVAASSNAGDAAVTAVEETQAAMAGGGRLCSSVKRASKSL